MTLQKNTLGSNERHHHILCIYWKGRYCTCLFSIQNSEYVVMSFIASQGILLKCHIILATVKKIRCLFLNTLQWDSGDIGYFFLKLASLNQWGNGCNILTYQIFISTHVIILTTKREHKSNKIGAMGEIMRCINPLTMATGGWLRSFFFFPCTKVLPLYAL